MFLDLGIPLFSNNFIESMNPQTWGEHVSLRHSQLWRKTMWGYNDHSKDLPSCHKQLNDHGEMGKSWRERDSMVKTNYSFLGRSTLQKTNHSQDLSKALSSGQKTSEKSKSLIKSLADEADLLDKNKQLVEGMLRLKDMGLLSGKEIGRVVYPGIIRHEHVHNDYHERVTNPGFSRNHLGRFYTK